VSSTIITYTGSEFCYAYRALPDQASQAQIEAYCSAVKDRFRPIARAFDTSANGIWVLRHYLALKFTISASILSGSAIHALQQNLLMGVPYFNYYTLLNCCRAYLMTSPDVIWRGVDTMKLSHEKILNLTANLMKRLDRDPARRWGERLNLARAHRETYSYRFPATGPTLVGYDALDPHKAADLARLIAELAMLNSECFQGVLRKHVPEGIRVGALADHDWASAYDIAGETFVDRDDRYRFQKFLYGWSRVSTLDVMASDGLIEDFYGGWCAEDPQDGQFDPDDWTDHLLWL
jgi:hypothetical protein